MKPTLAFFSTVGLVLAALCATGVPSHVHAQGASSTRHDKMRAELKKRFSAADTNADGRLSRDEAKRGMPRVYRNFDAIDAEKAGAVSLEQIAAFAEQRGGHR